MTLAPSPALSQLQIAHDPRFPWLCMVHHDNCNARANPPGKCNCAVSTVAWYERVVCNRCSALPAEPCHTVPGNHPTNTHIIRMGDARKYEDLFRPPPTPIAPWAERIANRRMHLKDQAITGPYHIEHDADRGQYQVIGSKRRTGGRVVLATFKYRANDELYWPMYEQSGMFADIFASRLNELHVTVKDPRHG